MKKIEFGKVIIRIALFLAMFCLVASVFPYGSSAENWLKWLLPSDSKTEKKVEPPKRELSKDLTITKIEPNLKDGIVNVTFNEACDINTIRNSIRIFPHVRLQWHDSKITNNQISIRGEFKAGQDYTIMLPETLECKGRKYVKTLNTFRMPDMQPNIHFIENQTVIERDSRQMIHASVTNVDELLFYGLRIPPVLIPAALKEINKSADVKTPTSYKALKEILEHKYSAIKKHLGGQRELKDFMGDIVEDSQLFFPGKERNKSQQFSIPLGFRMDKEKGAIEVVFLKSNKNEQKTESPVRLFRITDMGITYKISEDSLLIWVTSLNTGKPIGNVSLLAFLGNSEVIPLGKTDGSGIFFIKNMENRMRFSLQDDKKYDSLPVPLKNIMYVAAVSPVDSSFVEVKQSGTVKPDWVAQSRYPGEKKSLLRGHVFTERGIYRPGETVHFKGTIREYKDRGILPPWGLTPTFIILNSKNEEVYRKEIALSEFGTAFDTFDVKSYFPLGTYTIKMIYAKMAEPALQVEEDEDEGSRRRQPRLKDGIAISTFEVQEFKAPRHFVEILFKREKKKDESYINLDKEIDLLTANVSGIYYAGGPVKHGKVRWKIYYAGTNFKKKGYTDYIFGNTVDNSHELLESGESMLDEKGKITVTIPVTRDILSGIYGIEMIATVVDFDGRASTETTVYQEEPEYLLGISSHEDTVKAGDSHILKIIVLDKNGKKIEKGTVNVDVMRKEYVYVRKRNESGGVYWDNKEVYRKQLSSTLNIGKAVATFEFDFMYGGQYILKFSYKAPNGKEYSSNTMYDVEGYFYGYEYENRERNFEKLSIFTEKKEYSHGDKIRVFINPHRRLSSLIMTIEREGLMEYRSVELAPGQKYIDIPVENRFEPNIYISFLGIAARGDFPVYNVQFDDSAPNFLFGVVNVDVKKQIDHLKIKINEDMPDLKFEPSSEVTLKLSSKDKSGKGVETEMAVCVVDESVLALTGFKTPTLEPLSRFTLPLSVFTGDLRSELLKQTPFGYIRNEPLTGGDGGSGGKEFSLSKIRKDFRPVAYFNPVLRTDRSGNAEVKFKLPDTMTNYRVYVVACDKGNRFEAVQRDLLAVKDFYLEPGTPRFFTKGDKFKFSVSAFNKTNKSGTVRLSLDKDSLVNMTTTDAGLSLKAFDRILFPVKGNAVKPGISNLVFSGELDGKKDVVEIKIPVKSGHLLWNDVVYGTIKNAAKVTYTFPEGTNRIKWDELNPDDVKAVFTISGSPFLRMSKGLRYLLKYPYGCVEQTSSGVIPLSALRGLINDGLIMDMDIAETDKFLKPGIERLLSMQTTGGGFGYWPGDIQPNLWGTIYATSALTYAKLAGLDVPKDRMENAMQFLKKAIKEDGRNDYTFKAFAAYVLAMNYSLDESTFRDVYKDMDNMQREGALLILLAAKLGNYVGDKELIDKTMAIIEKRWEGKVGYSFYARYREPAISLIAGSAILKDESILGRLAKQLLEGVNKQGIWTSTSDTGWALLALGEYFKGKAFSDKPVKINLMQEGWPDTTAVIEPKGSYTYPLEPGSFLKKPEITVFVEGDMDLVYMLSLTFPRVDYSSDGYFRGFKMHKTIENTDGSKKIKLGDIVKVRIDIETEGDYNYVVIDDPLPAGLVAINTAIKTEERVGRRQGEDDSENDYYWGEWDYEGGFFKFMPSYFELQDDRVVAFKNQVRKGRYQYSYYARAVCEGEFIMPSTKVQLMYDPDTASFTPIGKIVIEGRE
jgi:uncharacterized protein YfaS (alpha-2-macroglobulin family)